MTERSYPMISIADAWARIAARIYPLDPAVRQITEALGLVLAEDIVATENMPPFPASAMDGYAVRAADASRERTVIGVQFAGQMKATQVLPGTAMRIMTGAPLPEGADAVVRVEDTTESNGIATLLELPAPGQYVRPAGQDIATNQLVLRRGIALGPAEIGLLAAVGRAQVTVHPAPRVAIMATGDELVRPDAVPGPGQIRDSNSYALAAAAQQAGFQPIRVGRIPDDEATLRAAILDGVSQADALLTSGGVSMGQRDLVKPLLEELGQVHFGRVATKPGKPITFATVRNKPVFGLPGFPVSSLVSFEMFVRPALRLLGGHRNLWRPRATATLAHPVRHALNRTEFQRAVVMETPGGLEANTTGDQVSGRLLSMTGANALLELAQGRGDFSKGETVSAILITLPEVS